MRIAALIPLVACVQLAEPAPKPGVAPQATAVACKPPIPPALVPLPSKAIAIAAQQAYACALLDTQRVWCWGNNEYEQAGLTARASATPPHDLGLEHVVEISLGYSAGCARHANGTTTCWGRKTSWNPQLPQSLAASPPPGRIVQRIAAGHDHACAIVRGNVECYGQLGNFSAFREPRVPGTAGATAIAAGDDNDCALVGGSVTCWGRPWQWSCDAQCEKDKQRPVAHRVPALADATSIAVGSFDACAVRKSGRVACWGAVNGARTGTVAPIEIPALADARQIALGSHHACAVRATGEIACWGEGYRGARGDGRTDNKGETPTTVVGIGNAVAVAAGLASSCALLADGRVTCWGVNDHRQLGFATLTNRDLPADVCALDRVARIAASYGTTCALRRDSTVACWGLGWGFANHSATPNVVPKLTGIVDLVGAEDGICARDRAGDVRCFTTWYEPFKLPGRVTHAALGEFGLCGVDAAGAVICDGAAVAKLGKATKVAVGGKFACALIGTNVTCWGPGTIIELPPCHTHGCTQPPVDRSPRKHALAKVVDLAATPDSICARTADGRVRCVPAWSQLDENTPEATEHPWSNPTLRNLPDIVQVAHGRDHHCALRANGLVACWGDNQYGQLGVGELGLVATPAH
jgi:alpha-tubulin suppressor-like RCC1 family protein